MYLFLLLRSKASEEIGKAYCKIANCKMFK